jgi:hypothetical protein
MVLWMDLLNGSLKRTAKEAKARSVHDGLRMDTPQQLIIPRMFIDSSMVLSASRPGYNTKPVHVLLALFSDKNMQPKPISRLYLMRYSDSVRRDAFCALPFTYNLQPDPALGTNIHSPSDPSAISYLYF